MDDLDRRLLNLIQDAVPLVREPFAELAARLGCEERRVLGRVSALREDGVIREISGIFDAGRLGYEQALVAMRVPPDRLEQAGRLAAAHPGVSHCYGREADVNLWLTLAVSPRSRLGLGPTAKLLASRCGAAAPMVLPTLRRYKLRVRFDVAGERPAAGAPRDAEPEGAAGPPAAKHAPPLDDEQLRAIRGLQADLPCCRDPFAQLAAEQGLHADMLLVHAADFLAAGWLRRYAAVLHHRAAGAAANVLVAWAAGEADADAAGRRCAELPAVSHCYLRPAAPGWPYNLYTMVHGRSREDCRLTIEEILGTTSLVRHVELWTAREFKKQRVGLFTGEEAAWEQNAAGPDRTSPEDG